RRHAERGSRGHGVRKPGGRDQCRGHRRDRASRCRRCDRSAGRLAATRRGDRGGAGRSRGGANSRRLGPTPGRDRSILRGADERGGSDLRRAVPAPFQRERNTSGGGTHVREWAKTAARAAATLAIVPPLVSFRIRAALMGANRALIGSSQLLSLVPGLPGQYLRRAFLARVLEGGCSSSAAIEFGTLFSQVGARIDERVYIGPRCHLGHVHLERDVLLTTDVHVPSGAHTHGTDLSTATFRDQPGDLRQVRIGAGSWIGSNAVVMADVGKNTIVGAGAVVTRPLPDRVLA